MLDRKIYIMSTINSDMISDINKIVILTIGCGSTLLFISLTLVHLNPSMEKYREAHFSSVKECEDSGGILLKVSAHNSDDNSVCVYKSAILKTYDIY